MGKKTQSFALDSVEWYFPYCLAIGVALARLLHAEIAGNSWSKRATARWSPRQPNILGTSAHLRTKKEIKCEVPPLFKTLNHCGETYPLNLAIRLIAEICAR